MSETFQQLFQLTSFDGIGALVTGFLLYLVAGLAPACGACYLIYFVATLPMRRNQRARSFLDLVDLGLKGGRTPEAVVMDAAASQDPSLGVRFHLLAAHLESGMRLSAALEKVPRLLPPQIIAVLKIGEQMGDVRKVLPACRHLMRDAVSQVRGAINYLVLLAFVLTPLSFIVPIVFRVKILPRYEALFSGIFEGMTTLPAFTRFVIAQDGIFAAVQIGIVALIWLTMLAYIGGPRLGEWVGRLLPGLPDAMASRLPWRRKRLQRDFSAMLALLLDAGVPEHDAVRMAGESTANSAFVARAKKVCAGLREGMLLPQAISAMGECGEFQWRLRNALRHDGGFLRALTGWHEALDAKAFQLEQTAAQLTTTGLVLANGLVVGCIAIGIFVALVSIINEAVLW